MTRRWDAPHPAAVLPPWEPWWSRRRFGRAASYVAIAISSLLVLTAGAAFVVLDQYDRNVVRLPGVVNAAQAPKQDEPLNLLLVGSDSREGLTGREAFQGKGRDFITGQRSDVVILAHVFRGGRQAQLVSIPRDTYVEIPAHRDPKTGRTRPAQRDRLNSAFQQGGPALLVDTVENLTGVAIQHYMQVDFRGFKTLVDRLGGVQVCLRKPQKDIRSGIDLPAGRQTVRGDQALAFVRQRQGLPRGDVDRIQRQQLLLGALVRKVLSPKTLLNPVRLNTVLQVATSSLKVDETLTQSRLRELVLSLRQLEPGAVVFTTAPIADLNARRSGASVVLLDETKSAQLFDRLRRDVPPPPRAAAAPPDQRTAAEDPCA